MRRALHFLLLLLAANTIYSQSSLGPAIIPSGPTDLCAGSMVSLRSDSVYVDYTWVETTTSTIIASGSTASSIMVDSSGTFVLTVTTASYSVKSSAPLRINISRTPPLSPIYVFGDSVICEGDMTDIIADTGFSTYSWYRNGSLIYTGTGTSAHKLRVGLAGVYHVIASDTGSICVDTSNKVRIYVNPAPKPSLSALPDSQICFRDSALLFVPPDFVSYQWFDTVGWLPGATANFYWCKSEGLFNILVTDSNGCTGIAVSPINVLVVHNYSPALKPPADTNFCQGDSVTLEADDPGLPNYTWYRNGVKISSASSWRLNVDITGTYHYSVLDTSGCIYYSDSITLTEIFHPALTLNPSGVFELCASGTERIFADTGYQYYQWFLFDSMINVSATPFLDVSKGGKYSVIGFDKFGCSEQSDTLLVVEVTSFTPDIRTPASQTLFCGQKTTILSTSQYFDYYEWYKNGKLFASGWNKFSVTVSGTGTYSLTVYDSIGCEGTGSIDLEMYDLPEFEILKERDTICKGEPVTIKVEDGVSFLWTSMETIIPDPNSDQITVSPKADERFMIEVTDEHGCTDTGSVIVRVVDCDDISVPSAFSPNADGINDRLVIRNIYHFPNNEFIVYNRYGEVVYSRKGYDNSWGGIDVPTGVYYYTVDLGQGKVYSGTITLIR